VALLFGTAWAEAQSDAAPATVAPVPALRADLDHDASALAFRDAFLGGALDWPLVVERARAEGVVRWYHWGGSEELNTWIDAVVVPALAQEGVRVESVRCPPRATPSTWCSPRRPPGAVWGAAAST
jgi:hypothetical protein